MKNQPVIYCGIVATHYCGIVVTHAIYYTHNIPWLIVQFNRNDFNTPVAFFRIKWKA